MKDFPVTYVLYSHFSQHEQGDFEAYKKATNKEERDNAIRNSAGIAYLKKYTRGLKELLTTDGHEGILLLYYAMGLDELCRNLASDVKKDKKALLESHVEIRFADHFKAEFEKFLTDNEPDLARRVRMITAIDLDAILHRVRGGIADKMRDNVKGAGNSSTYDSPKIPEAVVRLRMIGHGVPVFRVDQDVLFNDESLKKSDLGLFKAIACSVQAYKRRIQESGCSTFMFSASYRTKALLDYYQRSETKEKDLELTPFSAWAGTFATRIHPALCVDQLTDMPRFNEEAWRIYANNNVDRDLATRYYGLSENLDAIDRTKEAMTELGAHPFYSVISGALLCLSDGAILDLPPFSNFSQNVMWIDDHLKYSLHREMGHFIAAESPDVLEKIGTSRLDRVMVTKGRPSVGNLAAYTLGTYIPTLLLGMIVDSWITPATILKLRPSDLKDEEKRHLQEVRANKSRYEAPLPRALRQALSAGKFHPFDKTELAHSLENLAVERIEAARLQWSALATGSKRSFANHWAMADVKCFPHSLFDKVQNDLWRGLGPNPIKRKIDLPPYVLEALKTLVADAVDYVEWTLEWPKFIQVVRSSVEQGDFVGDLTWDPKATNQSASTIRS